MARPRWSKESTASLAVVVGVAALATVAIRRFDYDFHWGAIPGYLPQLGRALLLTLGLSAGAIVVGLAIGIVTGFMRIGSEPVARTVAVGYIELVRGTPLLVQIYIIYFVVGRLVSQLLSGTGTDVPTWAWGILALAVFVGAYVAEIFRAAVQSIDRGQMEAARALGLTYMGAMRFVILPQAAKRMLPPLAGQFISLVKDSSLLSVISISELSFTGKNLQSTEFRSFEIWFTVAALYLVLTGALSAGVHYLERRLQS